MIRANLNPNTVISSKTVRFKRRRRYGGKCLLEWGDLTTFDPRHVDIILIIIVIIVVARYGAVEDWGDEFGEGGNDMVLTNCAFSCWCQS